MKSQPVAGPQVGHSGSGAPASNRPTDSLPDRGVRVRESPERPRMPPTRISASPPGATVTAHICAIGRSWSARLKIHVSAHEIDGNSALAGIVYIQPDCASIPSTMNQPAGQQNSARYAHPSVLAVRSEGIEVVNPVRQQHYPTQHCQSYRNRVTRRDRRLIMPVPWRPVGKTYCGATNLVSTPRSATPGPATCSSPPPATSPPGRNPDPRSIIGSLAGR
jgi:hypothetical protein